MTENDKRKRDVLSVESIICLYCSIAKANCAKVTVKSIYLLHFLCYYYDKIDGEIL